MKFAISLKEKHTNGHEQLCQSLPHFFKRPLDSRNLATRYLSQEGEGFAGFSEEAGKTVPVPMTGPEQESFPCMMCIQKPVPT